MIRNRRRWLTGSLGLLLAAALAGRAIYPAFAGKEPVLPKRGGEKAVNEPRVTIYDPDPKHSWNRLHAALFVRVSSDGRVHGLDEIDPLLWPKSTRLLSGAGHRRARTALDEFLAKHEEKLIRDPVKRALLQHDLWAVFDWLANPDAIYYEEVKGFEAERRILENRVARAIRRLALSPKEIAALPDNYAAALAAKLMPTKHDTRRPETAFLPPDLFKADGPWVLLEENARQIAAPAHVSSFGGRSAFIVFLNLPAGRKATLDYLDKLGAFPSPVTPRPADNNIGFAAKDLPRLNPKLPQFPVGTQVALAREILVIDTLGRIQPTPLIESLQVRVYRDIPQGDPNRPQGFDGLTSKQDFYELRLSRRGLFSGREGGLRALGSEDTAFSVFFAHTHDPFETAKSSNASSPKPHRVMQSCTACHGGGKGSNAGPGIHSLLVFARGFTPGTCAPPHLVESKRKYQEHAVIYWKRQQYSWGLLEGLLASGAASARPATGQ